LCQARMTVHRMEADMGNRPLNHFVDMVARSWLSS
jgi:hypothetical protein